MEFIKRNVGLLAFCLLALVVSGFLGWKALKAAGDARDAEEKLKRQDEFLKQIGQGKVQVTEASRTVATENQALAKGEFEKVKTWLAESYTIPPEQKTPIECITVLRDECIIMARQLQDKQVVVPGDATYFSFGTRARNLPEPEEVPVLLKQLKIVQEVVRLAGDAQVAQFTSVTRLTDTVVMPQDLYDVIPLRVVVVGDLPTVNAFVNKLQRESKYLFFVKFLSLQSNDLISSLAGVTGGGGGSGGMSPYGSSDGEGSGGGMSPYGGRGGGMSPYGGSGSGGTPYGGSGSGSGGGTPYGGSGGGTPYGGSGGGMSPFPRGGSPSGSGEGGLAAEGMQIGPDGRPLSGPVLTREALMSMVIANPPHFLQADIRFDFVEFHAPAKE